LHAEDTPQGVYYLKDGYVRLFSVSDLGKELSLNIFKPGSFFPMTWAIADVPNRYFFEALTDVAVLRMPKDEVVEFLKREPDILLDLTRRILVGLEATLARIQYLISGSASEKVAATILMLGKRFGKAKNKKVAITLRITHKDIANFAGLTRETASQEIKKLEEKGLIEQKHQHLLIRDVQKLQKESQLNY